MVELYKESQVANMENDFKSITQKIKSKLKKQ